MTTDNLIIALRRLAKAWSIASILLIALFFFGEGFDPARVAPKEWVGLFFFPLGVVAGMILAWWKELPGGLITVASLLAFYLVYGLLLSGRASQGWAFIIFALPGFLFLASSLLSVSAGRRTA
jgi:hypothetical protein